MDTSQHVFPFNQVNDVEFKCMFSEVQYDITNNDMNFDMFSTRLDTDENGSLNDIDPDDNFSHLIIPLSTGYLLILM